MFRSAFLPLLALCAIFFSLESAATPVALIDGCTDPEACNFDPTADTDDGSCEYLSCACSDPEACNFDPEAVGTEITVTESFDWLDAPTVFVDQDLPLNDYWQNPDLISMTSGTWEVLDNSSFSCASQSPPNSITWNATQTTSNATFTFLQPASNVSLNTGGAGTNTFTLTHDGGTSVYSFPGGGDAGTIISFTETGITSMAIQTTTPGCLDDLTFTANAQQCTYPGCDDPLACNYDPEAGCSDGSCDYISCGGCTDPTACNYNPEAIEDDGSCEYDSCLGCTDPLACNYDPDAIPGGSLETFFEDFDSIFAPTLFAEQTQPISDYIVSPYLSITAGNWEVLNISSFSCAALSEPNSITWNPSVTTTFATLSFSAPASDVSFWIADNVNLDLTVNHSGGSTVLNLFGNGDTGLLVELAQSGITSLEFSNTDHFGCFDNLTYSVGVEECTYPGCTDELACNFDPEAGCEDDSCDFDSCYGCTDPDALNYDPEATNDDGTCAYTDCGGCLDPEACNYNPEATVDNEICYFAPLGFNCDGTCVDADDDGLCDYLTDGYPGCTAPGALNYQEGAVTDDGSCIFPSEICGPGTLWDFSAGQCVGLGDCSCPGDLNSDGVVGTVDLLQFLAVFGNPCPFEP